MHDEQKVVEVVWNGDGTKGGTISRRVSIITMVRNMYKRQRHPFGFPSYMTNTSVSGSGVEECCTSNTAAWTRGKSRSEVELSLWCG